MQWLLGVLCNWSKLDHATCPSCLCYWIMVLNATVPRLFMQVFHANKSNLLIFLCTIVFIDMQENECKLQKCFMQLVQVVDKLVQYINSTGTSFLCNWYKLFMQLVQVFYATGTGFLCNLYKFFMQLVKVFYATGPGSFIHYVQIALCLLSLTATSCLCNCIDAFYATSPGRLEGGWISSIQQLLFVNKNKLPELLFMLLLPVSSDHLTSDRCAPQGGQLTKYIAFLEWYAFSCGWLRLSHAGQAGKNDLPLWDDQSCRGPDNHWPISHWYRKLCWAMIVFAIVALLAIGKVTYKDHSF